MRMFNSLPVWSSSRTMYVVFAEYKDVEVIILASKVVKSFFQVYKSSSNSLDCIWVVNKVFRFRIKILGYLFKYSFI